MKPLTIPASRSFWKKIHEAEILSWNVKISPLDFSAISSIIKYYCAIKIYNKKYYCAFKN